MQLILLPCVIAASLRKLAKAGYTTYPEEPRTEWVLKQPAQLVIAVSQIYWCFDVEEHLRSENPPEGLALYLQVGAGHNKYIMLHRSCHLAMCAALLLCGIMMLCK